MIRWTAVAEDGHVERGRLTFTVEDRREPVRDARPTEPHPSPRPQHHRPPRSRRRRHARPSPSADTTPVASGGTDVLLPIVAALAIVGVVAYLVLRRGRTA